MTGGGALDVRRDPRGVVTLTLRREDVRNALDPALIAALREAFAAFADDDDARVVVLTGAGTAFCAGADLRWMRETAAGPGGGQQGAEALREMLAAVWACPRPVVVRVNGPARGGGVGLVAAADVAVADAGADFAFSEVRLGLAPAVISPYVVGKVGANHALRLFLTGEVFDAPAAERLGLVHVVAGPGDTLDAAVARVVDDLLAGGPAAQAEIKALVRAVASARDHDDTAALTVTTITRLRASAEGQEGMAAFLDRRPPSWRGGT